MSINAPLADVRAFHEAFGHPVAEIPMPITPERAEKRAGWVQDEAEELVADTERLVDEIEQGQSDVADLIAVQVDAAMDAIYFSLGTVVELGLDLDPLWKIVQEANMAKLHNGVAVKDERGKTVKPEGWEDPHPKIVAEIRRQMEEGFRRAA
jgi:predicted HAD superfamily Cof-like phosphohydrolase